MTYAAFMVFIEPDTTPEPRVRLVAGLAARFGATMIGLSARPFPIPLAADGMVIQVPTEADIKLMNTKLAEKGNWFSRIADGAGRKVEWRSALELPNEVITREARSADLIVVGQTKRRASAYESLDVGGAILRMGRPTLVVPDGVTSLRAEHVVIGWKDAREARRAVQDALPFLRDATRVIICEACGPGEEQSALGRLDDVARYLALHRIKSGPMVMVQKEGSGAAQLLEIAKSEKADLLVTGAYGHTRLGEWIFGGMTRDLLATSPICCLMSH